MNSTLSDIERVELAGDSILMQEFKHTEFYRVLRKYGDVLLESLKTRTLVGNEGEFNYNKGAYLGAYDALNLADRVIQLNEAAREGMEPRGLKLG